MINLKNNYLIYSIIFNVILIVGILLVFNRNSTLKDENKEAESLYTALTDTMVKYKNDYGEVVNEKLSIQTDLKNLEDIYDRLEKEKKELIDYVSILEKENTVIAAALYNMEFSYDSILNQLSTIDTTNKTISFSYADTSLDYSILISNVIPFGDLPPTLLFKSFNVYNTQKIDFSWENKREGKPVAFSIVNTNPHISISGMNSYIIPEIKKEEIKPTFWQKVKKTTNKHGDKLIFLLAGFGLGKLI